MTLGITLLLLFIPVIAIYIGTNFNTVTSLVINAFTVLQSVPKAVNDLWSIIPYMVQEFIMVLFVITLSVQLIKRFVGG